MQSTIFILNHIVKEVQSSRPVAVCLIVGTQGSTPQSPGALMVVNSDSSIVGTIGGGCVEADIRRKAFYLMQSKGSALVKIELNNESAADKGLICGGSMEVAVMTLTESSLLKPFHEAIKNLKSGIPAELPVRVDNSSGLLEFRLHIEPEPTLLIVGAGHISQELADLALKLEFKIVVIDNRADFACASRFPEPIETIVGDISDELKKAVIDYSTYLVIVTRGHKYDYVALEAVIDSKAKYIGMIGSRRKVHLIFKQLEEAGVKAELLKKVQAPIGLPINAITTSEIAVSIAAELIQVRRANKIEVIQGPFEVPS
jgi:xanthine dehydrogenase accessory factor